MSRLLCLLFVSLLSLQTFAGKINRVIYVTFDGTRWQDVVQDHTYFKKLWEKHGKEFNFYGVPNTKTTMEVASIPVSLPSYQSQTSGEVQPCYDNECGRIHVETFPESLLHKLRLNKKNIVTFSSWAHIDEAVQSISDTIYANTGISPAYDPETKLPDDVMADLNQKQSADRPKTGERFDKYTFAQAMHYFEKYQPRFMWMSFDDADDRAHSGDLEGYHRVLAFYDDSLDTLFTTLKNLGMDKDTLVIVTTDHGRGNGKNWTEHGVEYPESKQTWAFVMNGELVPMSQEGDVYHYSTLSVRRTIEANLGLK